MIHDNGLIFQENRLENIKEIAAKISTASALLEREIGSFCQFYQKRDNYLRKQNPYIVKAVIKYMAAGLSQNNAVIKVAGDYDTTASRVTAVFDGQKKYMAAVNLYARQYMCKKLRDAGMSARQIAGLLKISTNHVYKLLKTEITF